MQRMTDQELEDLVSHLALIAEAIRHHVVEARLAASSDKRERHLDAIADIAAQLSTIAEAPVQYE